MRRELPPFASIRSFEAAERLGSFKRAADELHVTQSAISHQVQALEQYLGVRLFLRGTRKVVLTRDGTDYLDELSPALDHLASATGIARDRDAAGPLFVRATPALAARWLVPRLTAFHDVHPRIELHISTSLEPADFAGEQVDVDIRFGRSEGPGLRVDPFLTAARFPVASPMLLDAGPPVRSPDDLRHFVLLHDEVGDGLQQWFDYAGVTHFDASPGPRFEHCSLVLGAAVEAQGVALAYDVLAQSDLTAGRLIKLFDISLPPAVIYSVVSPRAWSDHPRIAAFRDWLLRTAAS